MKRFDLGNVLGTSQRKWRTVAGMPHQRFRPHLQSRSFDLGILHLRLAVGLCQVDVFITDVLILASVWEEEGYNGREKEKKCIMKGL